MNRFVKLAGLALMCALAVAALVGCSCETIRDTADDLWYDLTRRFKD